MSGATVTDLSARLERGLLGAALRDETCRRIVLGSLSEGDYQDLSHRAAHAALVRLTGASELVDWENVLRVGDRRLLGRLVALDLIHAGRAVTVEKAASWAKHLRAQAAARQAAEGLRGALAWLESPASSMDPSEFFARAGQALSDAQRRCTRESGADASAVALETAQYLDSTEVHSLPTGLTRLDAVLGGLSGGKLYIIGGRSSVGKTAFVCTVTRSACEWQPNKRALFFSLEMLRRSLAVRWIAGLSGLDSRAIERRVIPTSHPALSAALQAFSRWPLLVDDTAGLSIGELCARATVAHSIAPLSVIVVDYLQLVKPSANARNQSREREVAEISASLKQLSKQLDVPVVALAQLNRDADKRQDKRPVIGDLRESDAITHDSDAVVLLHREWLYDKSVSPEKALAIVAKQRDGECGEVELRYLGAQVRFLDAEGDEPLGAVVTDEWSEGMGA
jgi:replicative DNA helicase